MAAADTSTLAATSRAPEGSRTARRLRREGRVPGVLYGGGEDPVPFAVDARELRQAIAHSGALIELRIDDGPVTPVLIKEKQRHHVRDEDVHVDLLRVRLDQPIQATVTLELIGGEDAPGVKQGGVLEQALREISIESLPTAIPDVIVHDVSGMEINDTITLAAVAVPEGVTFLEDLEETVIATLSPPRLQTEEEELETETELVGEGGAPEEGAGESGEGGGE